MLDCMATGNTSFKATIKVQKASDRASDLFGGPICFDVSVLLYIDCIVMFRSLLLADFPKLPGDVFLIFLFCKLKGFRIGSFAVG